VGKKRIDLNDFAPSPYFIQIGNILVDCYTIVRVSYYCSPQRFCNPSTTCCSFYGITLTEHEIAKIDSIMDTVSKYSPILRLDKGCYENVFGEISGTTLYWIDSTEDGRCIFSYLENGETIKCAIHSAAIDLGLKPGDYKPRECTLWPLSLVQLRGKLSLLTVDKYVSRFRCVQKNQASPYPSSSIEEILVYAFGKDFCSQVREHLNILSH
jgi:hypothetical protein